MEPLPEPTYRLYNCCRCGVLVDIFTRCDRGNIYADLLFEVITRRYQLHLPVILTTNKPSGEWNQVFLNAACVVALVDRLVHRSEILTLAGNSYRLKEAQERAARGDPRGGPRGGGHGQATTTFRKL